MDMDAAIGEKIAEYAESQKKIFTRWINSRLKQSRVQVTDVTEDFKDGQKLCTLLEVISGKNIPGVSKKKLTAFKLQNVNKAFKFLEEHRVELLNIGPEDIVEGKEKLVLALIWSIILRFQIQDSLEPHEEIPSETGQVSGEETEKPKRTTSTKTTQRETQERLKSWCNDKLSSYGLVITDFDSSWKNGMAFCAILHKYRPELFNMSSLKPEEGMRNLELAFATAEKHLGICQLMEPEDFMVTVDQKCVLLYVSMLHEALEKTVAATTDENPLSKLVTNTKLNIERLEKYELSSKRMIEWLETKIKAIKIFCYPSSLAAMDALITEWQTFCRTELPKQFEEYTNLEKTYESLSNNFYLNLQCVTFNEEYRFENIKKLWSEYDVMLKKHQTEICNKMRFYLELENQVYKFNRQFEQRKMWILETKALLSRNISEEDLDSLEKLKVKFGLVKKEMDLFEPKVTELSAFCDRTEKTGYFDIASLKYKNFEIMKLWNSLLDLYKKKTEDLSKRIKQVSTVKDVVFMKAWKTQIEVQLSSEMTTTTSAELQAAVQLIKFADESLKEYRKKCDDILSTGIVERNGINVKIEVTDELKEYLLEDIEDLVELAESRNEEISVRQKNLYLFNDKVQYEAWYQSVPKSIPVDDAKKLIMAINTALAGDHHNLKHTENKFKASVNALIDEYKKKQTQLEKLIQFCEKTLQEETELEMNDIIKAKSEMESLRKRIVDTHSSLCSEINALDSLADLIVHHHEQRNKLRDLLITGETTENEKTDPNQPESNISIEQLIEDEMQNLALIHRKLLDCLKESHSEYAHLGLCDIEQVSIRLNESIEDVKKLMADQADEIKSLSKSKQLKVELEALSIWIDDREFDIKTKNAENQNKMVVFGSKQDIIACNSELSKLTEDESILLVNLEKIKVLEPKIRKLATQKKDMFGIAPSFMILQERYSDIQEGLIARKRYLEKLTQMNAHYEETNNLLTALTEKSKLITSICKPEECSNEDLITLRKKIADYNKQVDIINQKIQLKQDSLEILSKDSTLDLTPLLKEFDKCKETQVLIADHVKTLEKDCRELSDMENFESSLYDLKNWVKSSCSKLEDLDESSSTSGLSLQTHIAVVEEISEEMEVRHKEYDALDILRRKIEQSPDKAKLSPHMKSFKNCKVRIKHAQVLIAKLRARAEENIKLSSFIMSMNYVQIMIQVAESFVMSIENMDEKSPVNEHLNHLASFLSKENFYENKIKNLQDQLSMSKFNDKKAISEAKTQLINMKKRLVNTMKKGRKELKELRVISDCHAILEQIHHMKVSLEQRRNLKKLYDSLDSKHGQIDFLSFCKVMKMQVSKMIISSDELKDELDRMSRKNATILKNINLEIEQLQTNAMLALSEISQLAKEHQRALQSSGLTQETNAEIPLFKLNTLRQWLSIARFDVNYMEVLKTQKPLFSLNEGIDSTKEESSSQAGLSNIIEIDGLRIKTTSSTTANMSLMMLSEIKENFELVDSEYSDVSHELENEEDEAAENSKSEFLLSRGIFSDNVTSIQNSLSSMITLSDLLSVFTERLAWLDQKKVEVLKLREITQKGWKEQLQRLQHYSLDITTFKELYFEETVVDFKEFLAKQTHQPSMKQMEVLPELFMNKIAFLEKMIQEMTEIIQQKSMTFRVSERCHLFIKWLLCHQGFYSFTEANAELSSDICVRMLQGAHFKDITIYGEIELNSIKEMYNTLCEEGTENEDIEKSIVLCKESKESIELIMSQTHAAYQQVIEITKYIKGALKHPFSVWRIKQIMKEYSIWCQPAERFSYMDLDQDVFECSDTHSKGLNNCITQLFRLKAESLSMDCLKENLLDRIEEADLSMRIDDIVEDFNERKKKSIANAEAQCSMMRSIHLKEHVGDYCKFLLGRIKLMQVNIDSEPAGSTTLPENRAMLMLELVNSQSINLKPKAEESKVLLKHISAISATASLNSFEGFINYHAEVRDSYDHLTQCLEFLLKDTGKKWLKFKAQLSIKEDVRMCHSFITQIRNSPAPKTYDDCIFRSSGHNNLRDIFNSVLTKMKSKIEEAAFVLSLDERSALYDQSVEANILLRAEWESSSEILTCQMEMAQFIVDGDLLLKKMRNLKKFTQQNAKEYSSKSNAGCLTQDVLNGQKANFKAVSLTVEDKNVVEILNKRCLNIEGRNTALANKLNKSEKKKFSSKKRSETSDSADGSDNNKVQLALLYDSGVHFTLEAMQEEGLNSDKAQKQLNQKNYMFAGVYVLPEDVEPLLNAVEKKEQNKKSTSSFSDVEFSNFYPEFKLYIYKFGSNPSVKDLLFTFDLRGLTIEKVFVGNSYSVKIQTKSGSRFMLDSLTFIQQSTWFNIFSLIHHLTVEKTVKND